MIRSTPTRRQDFKAQNMFKGIEVTPNRLYRKDNYTLWIVLITIAMGLIVLANEAGIIHVVDKQW